MDTQPRPNQTLLVTGEAPYLSRHNYLWQALSPYFGQLHTLERHEEWYEEKIPRLLLKYLYTLRTFSKSKADTLHQKNAREFIAKSRRMEQRILQSGIKPDFVLHIFNTFSPFWDHDTTPHALYLDYTMRLSQQQQLPWAFFLNSSDRDGWLACEQRLFDRATYLFCQSQIVQTSLVQDYGIPESKAIVVGAAGNYQQPFAGEKTFGSQQLLFNGSDFERKGGDLVLAAFEKIRAALPDAKLVVIGRKLLTQHSGVENPGHVSPTELKALMLNTDLVLAPAYSDPFPRFVMEAMNYGVPCVVSNQDGMPEIVDYGASGVVVDQPTARSLADTVVHLLNHPDRLTQLSQAAQTKIKTHLNWDTVARKIGQTIAGKGGFSTSLIDSNHSISSQSALTAEYLSH